MSTDPASTFNCPDCDITAPSTSVPYDTLGYAVCPFCSYATGPASGTDDFVAND